jgi:RNA polymerase sigma-70 factor (ECF subfamily)
MDSQIERLIERGEHRAALAALVDAHGAALGRFCAGMLGSVHDGEEALQDALVQVLGAMPTFRGGEVRPWVFGIARRVCADLLRKRGRRRSLWGRLFGHGEEAAITPTDGLVRVALERALLRLSPGQREALLLRYQLGLDATEVADVLQISHDAARKRISLALQALRTDLIEEENHDHALRSSHDSAVVRS